MIDDFRRTMQSAGLNPPEHIEPGRFYRFPGVDKLNGNTAGWCKLFLDGQGGSFGDWSQPGLKGEWQSHREQPLTRAEREAFRMQVEESRRQAEEQRRRQQQRAAVKASEILLGAEKDPATHRYAVTKNVPLGDLVRCGPWPQRGWTDALLIPIYDESGRVVSVQAINEDLDDKKDFLFGGRKKGCFHPLGKLRGTTGSVLIGEGLATVAAVVSATGLPGAVAFDADNLLPVAEVVRRLSPDAEIIFLADDDQKSDTDNNTGIEAANKAALAVGGMVAVPGMGRKADFWDLWHECGADAVRRAIGAAVPVEDQQGDKLEVKPLDVALAISERLPPKEFVLKPYYPKGCVGTVNGTGGAGKSYLVLVQLVAVATGRAIGIFKPPSPARAMLVNVEDGEDDLRRRLYWIAEEYQLTDDEKRLLSENLIILPGQGIIGPMMQFDGNGNPVENENAKWLREQVERYKPAMLALDTRARLFGLQENDNSQATIWMGLLENISRQHGTAIAIASHVSKGATGSSDQHASRGASAFIDNGRFALNLTWLDDNGAKAVGLPNPSGYTVLSHAKASYGPRAEPVYFRANEHGVPVQVDFANVLQESLSAALDTLVEVLAEDHPEGFPKRDLMQGRGDEAKKIRQEVIEVTDIKKSDFAKVVDMGIESARLEEIAGSRGRGVGQQALVKPRLSWKGTNWRKLTKNESCQSILTEKQEHKTDEKINWQEENSVSFFQRKNSEINLTKNPPLKGDKRPCQFGLLPPGADPLQPGQAPALSNTDMENKNGLLDVEGHRSSRPTKPGPTTVTI